jgi:hypothetical protein
MPTYLNLTHSSEFLDAFGDGICLFGRRRHSAIKHGINSGKTAKWCTRLQGLVQRPP